MAGHSSPDSLYGIARGGIIFRLTRGTSKTPSFCVGESGLTAATGKAPGKPNNPAVWKRNHWTGTFAVNNRGGFSSWGKITGALSGLNCFPAF